MNTIFLFGATLLTSCLQGPSPFSKEGTAGATYAMVTQESDGVAEGLFTAGVSTDQMMKSSATGSSVMFPAGSLSINTTVSLQHGINMANSSTMSAMGVSSGVSSAGSSIVVSSSTAVNASNPFSLQLGVSGTSLALNDSMERLVVLFKIFDADKNEYRVGVILRKDITIVDAKNIKIETKYFGSYQPAFTDSVMKQAIKPAPVNSGIMTRNEEKQKPKIEWNLSVPAMAPELRAVMISMTVKGFDKLAMCTPAVFKDGGFMPLAMVKVDGPMMMERLDRGERLPFRIAIPFSQAELVRVKVSCADKEGRQEESQASATLQIPAVGSGVGGGAGGGTKTLKIVGFGDPATSPTQRWIDNDNTTDVTTIAGECQSGQDIEAQIATTLTTTPYRVKIPCSSDSFQLRVGHTAAAAGSFDLKFDDAARSYAIRLKQGMVQVRTVLFYLSDVSRIKPISNLSLLNSADNVAGNWFVLTQDVDLSTAGSTRFTGTLNANFDGDHHTVTGLSQTEASQTEPWGMIKAMTGTSQISNLVLRNPSYSLTTDSGPFNSVGALVGTVTGTCTACRISGVEVESPRISFIDTAPASMLGGLVGEVITTHPFWISDVSVSDLIITAKSAVQVGGIVGSGNVRLDRIKLFGSIHAKSSVGGLVGQSANAGANQEFQRVSSVGNIVSYQPASSAEGKIGGLIGYSLAPIVISQAYAEVILNAQFPSTYYGGLIGLADTSLDVQDSFVHAKITGSPASMIGGLIGKSTAATGTVSISRVLTETEIDLSNTSASACSAVFGFSAIGTSLPSISRVVLLNKRRMTGCSGPRILIGARSASAFNRSLISSSFAESGFTEAPIATEGTDNGSLGLDTSKTASQLFDSTQNPLSHLVFDLLWKRLGANGLGLKWLYPL